MDLHIQKFADRMDGKWGAGQSLEFSLPRWYTKWGRAPSLTKEGELEGVVGEVKKTIDNNFLLS
jgi:hypothetical protein